MTTVTSTEKVFPFTGTCANCRRERDDLFRHNEDGKLYCQDVARCEYRYYLQGEREAKGLPYRRLTRPA